MHIEVQNAKRINLFHLTLIVSHKEFLISYFDEAKDFVLVCLEEDLLIVAAHDRFRIGR